jgi:hypothetical protein
MIDTLTAILVKLEWTFKASISHALLNLIFMLFSTQMWQFVTHSLLLENLHYWACSNCSHWSSSCYLNVEQVFYVLMGVVISHVPNDIFLFPFFFE